MDVWYCCSRSLFSVVNTCPLDFNDDGKVDLKDAVKCGSEIVSGGKNKNLRNLIDILKIAAGF